MPIEIKELHIRMTVNANDNQSSAGRTATATQGSPSQATNNEALIAECVEQVLQILPQKLER